MTNKQRAENLLKRMTLTEKIGQLVLFAGCNVDDKGVPDSPELIRNIREGKVGSIIMQPQDLSAIVDTLQKIAVEETRLHIPLFVNSDMIHGFETVFPIPLAAACSFDTDLVEKCAKMSAEEAVACGVRYTNAPMVDISRDPRWGRIAESQGEDPYLAGEMAKAYVRGYQNDETYVMATLKHYAGYGACEGGRDYDVVEMNENTMLNTYLVPFREGVSQGADSVMTGFNVLENVPISGNKKYLKEILREKFGFAGIVISDAGSINELMPYGVCGTIEECNEKAIAAGVDIDLGGVAYPNGLENSVLSGRVDERLVDEAVLRILEKKYELGLFDNPYSQADKTCVFSKAHLDVAEELAIESAVLLQNDGVLPLAKGTKVALVGKFADEKDVLGCWQNTSRKEDVESLKDVLLSKGYTLVGVSESYEQSSVEKAISGADAVLFTCGEYSEQSGEAHCRHDLRMSNEEIACMQYLKQAKAPVVTLVFGGRPLVISGVEANATVYCWDLGHRTAAAIVKLLFGERNFSGKLSVTMPKSEGQLPIYYAKKKLGRPYEKENTAWRFQAKYEDGGNEPQYPFGYGLSYSQYSYGNLRAEKSEFSGNEWLKVSVDVENVSDVDGVEIVQLYINDTVSEVIRPIKELKDFKRVAIKARQKVTVDFFVTEEKLKYYHIDGGYRADSGTFEIFVGGNSEEKDKIIVAYTNE